MKEEQQKICEDEIRLLDDKIKDLQVAATSAGTEWDREHAKGLLRQCEAERRLWEQKIEKLTHENPKAKRHHGG